MGFKKSRKILGLDFGKCRDWDFEKIPRSMDIPLVGPGTESWSMSIRTFVFLPFWLSSSYSLLEFVRTPSQARGGICHCRRQCKIFASGVHFSIFTHFLCFFLLKLLKLGEIDGVKFLAWKSGGVKFWTNSMSVLCCLRTFLCCWIFLLLDLWSLTPTSDPNNVNPSSWNRFESCIFKNGLT